MRRLDVGIGGCGVAGLALATLLRAQGHRVVLFDRLDAPRPLGSGLILQPVGLAVLALLGLEPDMRACGARIERLFGKSEPSGRVVLDVRYAALRDGVHGVAVHRGTLFGALFAAAQGAGATIETDHAIVAAADGRFALEDGGRTARFDLLVDALGVRSPLAPREGRLLDYGALWANVPLQAGFDPHALEQRYRAARKMAGVLPIGALTRGGASEVSFFWSLKGADFDAWRAAPLDAWKADVRALWPKTESLLGAITDHDQLVFARYAHRTLASPVGDAVVHVGDSFHCTSPQLGQGANFALLDACALAFALEAHENLEAALADYSSRRLTHVHLYQAASWLFTPVYQSDMDILAWLRDRIAAPLSRVPPAPQILAALVAGQIGAPLSSIDRQRLGARRNAVLGGPHAAS